MLQKKYIFIVMVLLLSFYYGWDVFAAKLQWGNIEVACEGLPGCSNNSSVWNGWEFIAELISQAILYLSAIAVIALILSGMMYIFSAWEDEKTKKAKTWIIWSLVGVFISIAAWGIINLLNSISITL